MFVPRPGGILLEVWPNSGPSSLSLEMIPGNDLSIGARHPLRQLWVNPPSPEVQQSPHWFVPALVRQIIPGRTANPLRRLTLSKCSFWESLQLLPVIF
jgi:hypothetical protein